MTALTNSPVTLVVTFSTQPERQGELVALLRESTEKVITGLKGWVSTRLIASDDGDRVVIYSQWETADDVSAMRSDPRMAAYFPKVAEIAAMESTLGATVMAHHR